MKLLLITHDTSRSGAPMVLLHFLSWLKVHRPEMKVDVLALKGGALEVDFKRLSATYYDYKDATQRRSLSFFVQVLRKLNLIRTRDMHKEFVSMLAQKNYDVVYANTVVSIPIATEIKGYNNIAKLVAHVHELSAIIKMLLPDFKDYQEYIDINIVPSKLVKQHLINNWGLSEKFIEVVYECASINIKQVIAQKYDKRFVVGASGLVHWRKGYDVFIQLAKEIRTKYRDSVIDFVWVGHLPKKEAIIIEQDLEKLGLSKHVSFIGEVSETTAYYANFDVFVMTSREDPFPLVCVEVGQLGKPIISFDKAVGTNEILKKGGGYIVPYLDVPAMAEKVMIYYNDNSLKLEHGKKNIEAFSQFTPDIICPNLFNIINTVIDK